MSAQADPSADVPGGTGGEARPSRSDLRLTERAVRQRWITPEQQQQIADALIGLATDRSQGRTAVAASRVVAQLDKLDWEREKLSTLLNPPPEPEPQTSREPDVRDLLETRDVYMARKARLLDQWRQEDQAETATAVATNTSAS